MIAITSSPVLIQINMIKDMKSMKAPMSYHSNFRAMTLGMLSLTLLTAFSISSANAQTVLFQDNFNRSDVALTSDGSSIGADYVVDTTDTDVQWGISSDELVSTQTFGTDENNGALIYTGLTSAGMSPTITAGDTISATGYVIDSPPYYLGLIFNYQDGDDFSALRVNTNAGTSVVQLIDDEANGVSAGSLNETLPFLISTTAPVTLSLTETAPDDYNISVTQGLNTFTDSIVDSNFSSGGYTGLYVNQGASFTNFEVVTAPEPSALVLFLSGFGILAAWQFRRRNLAFRGSN